jgi:VanZ family protein
VTAALAHRARATALDALRWLPAVAWMAMLWVLSDQPGLSVSEDPSVDLPIRRAAHVGVYGVLAVLFARALRTPASGWRLAAPWLLAVAYGALDEWHQTQVPSRSGSAGDVGFDAVGAAVGVVAWVILVRSRARSGP